MAGLIDGPQAAVTARLAAEQRWQCAMKASLRLTLSGFVLIAVTYGLARFAGE